MAKEGKTERRTLKGFLDSKIVQKDVGEETYLTWRETISYALGRGAQGMFTSMTGSKYLNYFLTTRLWAFWLIKPVPKRDRCVHTYA